jgi:hypothetical protein
MAGSSFISNSESMIKLIKITGNSYIRFILKLIILIAIVLVFDRVGGKILEHFYFSQENGFQYRTTYTIEETRAEILIFGSSRANHHYHPEVFENRLRLTYYNAGRDGNYIFYHAAVLKGVLKRYTPKIIILDFVSGEFEEDQISYDRLSSLLPYYKSHPEMRPIIRLKSRNENLKLLSHIYPYNSSIFAIAAGNADFNKKRNSDIKGYIPLNKKWNGSARIDSVAGSNEIDSVKVRIYKSFITDCINNNVSLFVVISPYLIVASEPTRSIVTGKEIAKKYNIPFIDMSGDTLFLKSPKLFADIHHLNDTGARVFSNLLIDKITSPADIKLPGSEKLGLTGNSRTF